MSTPFDVSVVKSNVTSANYTLTAEVQTADPVNTWMIDTFPLTIVPAAATSLTVTGVYGANVVHTLYLTIPFSAGLVLFPTQSTSSPRQTDISQHQPCIEQAEV